MPILRIATHTSLVSWVRILQDYYTLFFHPRPPRRNAPAVQKNKPCKSAQWRKNLFARKGLEMKRNLKTIRISGALYVPGSLLAYCYQKKPRGYAPTLRTEESNLAAECEVLTEACKIKDEAELLKSLKRLSLLTAHAENGNHSDNNERLTLHRSPTILVQYLVSKHLHRAG